MDKLLFCFSSLFCIHYWHILTCLWMMCQWYCYYITIMLTSHSIIPLPEYACKSYTFTNTWTIFHSVYVLNSKGHTALVACSTLSLSCSYHTKWKKALNGDTDSAGKTAPLIIETMTVQDRYQENVVQDQVHPSSIQLPSTLFTSSPKMLCRRQNKHPCTNWEAAVELDIWTVQTRPSSHNTALQEVSQGLVTKLPYKINGGKIFCYMAIFALSGSCSPCCYSCSTEESCGGWSCVSLLHVIHEV